MEPSRAAISARLILKFSTKCNCTKFNNLQSFIELLKYDKKIKKEKIVYRSKCVFSDKNVKRKQSGIDNEKTNTNTEN